MIDLLGIGVWDRGDWRLRRLCARLEGRGLTAILADRRDERLALLDVVAGRVVPSERRAWINGTPLSPERAARGRARRDAAAFYLSQIARGVLSGELALDSGEHATTLATSEFLVVEIEVKQKKRANSIAIKLRWPGPA